ncbi:hypothetical protein [Candidatus Pelagibacter sp.]|uniref:hypothetical protein n=1 Tax=Candidatus Pelagibacter sp. TaxID=2024849 RepID=UPI003F854475
MNFLKIKLSDINLKNLLFFYIFSLVIFITISSFYLEILIDTHPYLIDKNNNLILKSLPFDYGDLLHNLYYKGEYIQRVDPFDLNFHLARLPFFPIFLLFLAKINLNIYFIFFSKNILSFSLIFFCSFFFLKDFKKSFFHFIILLTLFWYNPYNTHVLLSLSFSDTLVSVFFPLIFLLINSKNFYLNLLFGALIFCLYLLKPSIWFFCLIFPVTNLFLNYFIFKKKYFFTNLLSIFFLLAGIFSWGFFGMTKSNYFPFASSSNSTNTFYLTSMLNKNFNSHYPKLSVDLLLDLDEVKNIKFQNEKEIYDYFKEQNLNFVKQNSYYYLQGLINKIDFILFGIHEDGRHVYHNNIRYSNIPNKILLNLALLIALLSIFRSIRDKSKISYFDLIFLFMIALYLAPHIIAWATSKHLVSIFILSKIYIFVKIFKCSKY